MFKSLRNFTLDKPINTKRLKVIHTSIHNKAYTSVQLWDTIVLHRTNINNLVTLNSGGYRTTSTKHAINTALKQVYGLQAPYLYQSKGKWFIEFIDGRIELFFDGIVIGGGSGIQVNVLN